MRAVTAEEMRGAEIAAMAAGWPQGNLLRLAGRRLGWAIGRFFPTAGTAVAYLGKGHNAGDAVVALGVLRDHFGWNILARPAFPESQWAPLLREVWQETGPISALTHEPHPAETKLPLLLIDGLAGIGLRGPLSEPMAAMVREIARLRNDLGAAVAAVDVPSGIDPDSGLPTGDAVIADATFSIGNLKSGLLKSVAVDFTGALSLVPLEPLTAHGSGSLSAITPQSMPRLLRPRPHETHKGNSGRLAILAGSSEYPGAAILCATAALRAGAGLVFLHVPDDALDSIIPRCPPEIIVRSIRSPEELFAEQADAFVVGCGLGTWAHRNAAQLVRSICNEQRPVVIDADALNAIAESGGLDSLGPHHVLTPHPGEFHRLAPHLTSLPREEAVAAFAQHCHGTLLLKGARSLICQTVVDIRVNTTGHPGMAKGGQGDWLAGIIGALLAAGQPPLEAACLGAWIAGRCGELGAWHHGHSQESLCPADFSHWMGRAFRDWKQAGR